MKKILLISFVICGLFKVHCQTQITLTFIGVDSLSQDPVSLDSVYIQNLTEDCDTLLYGPEPVLSVPAGHPTGINETIDNSKEEFYLAQNYPNPFHGSTIVSVYRNYRGPLNLLLYDVSGLKLAEYHDNIEKGLQSFVISSSGNKIMILSASDNKNNRSVKIVSNGSGDNENNIRLLGQIQEQLFEMSTPVFPDNTGFIFYLGDQMNYTAYASGYNAKTITDNPVSDSTYYFYMSMSGLPSVTTAAVTWITKISAISGGAVTSDGGADVTARGVCWSNLPGPVVEGNHTTDGSGTGTFVSTITGLTPNTLYYVRAYAINSFGTAYGNEESFTTLPWSCGYSITINHEAGPVAPVTKTVTYGTVTNIPGETSKCWITSNLGANHQAIAVDDSTEASAGWYWQFNRMQGYKHNGIIRTPNTTWITPINENSEWQAANDPCTLELADGWRIPTYTEWYNVDSVGNWTDWNGPWNSALKIHAAGYLYYQNGNLAARGLTGHYWSSTQYSTTNGWMLESNSGGFCVMMNSAKSGGKSLRCIKD